MNNPGTIVIIGASVIAVAWFGGALLTGRKRSKKKGATISPSSGPPAAVSTMREARTVLPRDTVVPRGTVRPRTSAPPRRPDIVVDDLTDAAYVSDGELRKILTRVLPEIRVKDIPTPGPGQELIVAQIMRAADGDSGAMKNTGHGTRTGCLKIEAVFRNGSWVSPQRQHPADCDEFRIFGGDAWELAQGKAGDLGVDFAHELLLGQSVVMLLRGKDDYGRYLADVYVTVDLGNHMEVRIDYAKALVRTGRGINYRGSKRPEGDPAMQKLEDEAHAEHIGRWQYPDDDYQLPHEWRKQKRREKEAVERRAALRASRAGDMRMRKAARATGY